MSGWFDDMIAMRLSKNGVESTPRRAIWDFINADIVDDAAGNRKVITVQVPGDLNVAETLRLSGIITPTQLTASQNNYNPTSLADATIVQQSANAAGYFIGGIAGGAKGRVLVWRNTGSFNWDFDAENASSTAANRIIGAGPTGRHSVAPNESAVMYYDDGASRWAIVGTRTDVLGRFTVSASGTGDFNNLSRSTGTYVLLSPTGSSAQALTGMEASTDRGLVCLTNGGTQMLLVKHENASSTAALRFLTPDGRDYPFPPGASVWAIYSAASARWRIIGPSSEPLHGTALTGAAGTPGQTITVDQGAVRTLYGNLAQASILDIDNTNAIDDESITIVSLNVAAFTYTIRDHSNAQVAQIPASTRMAVTLKKVTGANFANAVYTRL